MLRRNRFGGQEQLDFDWVPARVLRRFFYPVFDRGDIPGDQVHGRSSCSGQSTLNSLSASRLFRSLQ